jgi:hypothetical protein
MAPTTPGKPRAAKAGKPKTGASGYQLLPIRDVTGGIDLRRSPSLLAANRARTLRNWSLQEQGALLVYPGFKSFSTASLGNGRIQGGQRVYLSSGAFSLGAFGGSVYKPSDAGVWGAAVLAGLDAAAEVHFPFDRTFVAALDGVHVPKKSLDGLTWTQLGISAPVAAPTLNPIAGGTLTSGDQLEISFSYRRATVPSHEGNEGPTALITPAAGNLSVDVVCAASADPQVTEIDVYVRDVTAGETTRQRAGFVANPGVGTATVHLTAITWTAAGTPPAPTTNGIAPIAAFGANWKNRWWLRDAVVKNRLWFSQIFDVESYPPLFFLDVPFPKGDNISAFLPQGNTLVLCGDTSIMLIVGQTSLDFEVRPALSVMEGALGARAMEAIENGVVHAGAGGVYLFDGASDRLLSYDIDPGWQHCMSTASVQDLKRLALAYHAPRKELRIAMPTLFPFGTPGEWILDLNRTRLQEEPAWTSTDRAIGGYISWNGAEAVAGARGKLFSWSTTIGKLYQEATGTDADGQNMIATYEGPTLTTEGHVAAFIDTHGEFQPAGGSLTQEIFVDGVSQGQTAIPIGGNQATYDGTAQYDTATYAGATRTQWPAQLLPLSAEGISIQATYQYAGQDPFRLYNYGIGLVLEPALRGM